MDNTCRTLPRASLLAALGIALAATASSGALAQVPNAQAVLESALTDLHVGIGGLSRKFEEARTARVDQCAKRDQAWRDLLVGKPEGPLAASGPAGLAARATEHCDSAIAAERAVESSLRRAQTVFGMLLRDAPKCKTSTECAATALQGEVREIVTALNVPRDDATTALAATGVLKTAVTAQERVDEIKGKAKGLFTWSDSASKQALQQEIDGNPQARSSVAAAAQSRAAVDQTRRAIGLARDAANDLVDNAVELARCKGQTSGDCLTTLSAATQAGSIAQARLERHLTEAGRQLAAAKRGVFEVTANADLTSSPEKRAQAVRFLTLMDSFTDAKSAFSTDSTLLSAGKEGTQAVLRLSLARTGIGLLRTSTVALATPASKEGDTAFSDALSKAATIEFSQRFARLIGKSDDDSTPFMEFAAAARLGSQEHSYLDGKPGAEKQTRTRPWGLSIQAAWMPAFVKDGGVHIFRYERQRSFDDQPVQTRCPLPIDPAAATLTCTSGSYGPPTAEETNLFSYQLRTKVAGYGIAPMLSFNRGQRITEFSLPIYFIGNTDTETGGLTGGIKVGYVRQSAMGDRPKDGTVRFGIFLGAPFSTYKPGE